MSQSDLHLLLTNMFFAAALAGKVGAMYVGFFFAALMIYYTLKGK